LENLEASADLEKHVHTGLYPGFAKVGRDEGFNRAADFWDAISIAEVQHEKTFLALAENIRTGKVFAKDTQRVWRCRNCGYIHEGKDVPGKCPACVRPSDYFELLAENW